MKPNSIYTYGVPNFVTKIHVIGDDNVVTFLPKIAFAKSPPTNQPHTTNLNFSSVY